MVKLASWRAVTLIELESAGISVCSEEYASEEGQLVRCRNQVAGTDCVTSSRG